MNTDPHKTAYLLKCMMENMSDMIYFKDRDSKFIMVNKAAAAWQGGWTPSEWIGKSDFDSYSKEDAERMREDERRIMESEESLYGLEEGETRKDGTHAWVSTTKMPLYDEAGAVIGIFGISRDITEHKEAEIRAEKLAEENRQFRVEMEDDLLMASQLQKTFFPNAYPTFQSLEKAEKNPVEFCHFHRPGGLLGGDLCSIRKLSETKAGIFLCDVMGHGVRAALGVSIVRAVLEELSPQKISSSDFLEQMNKALIPLFRQKDQFMFATACYIILDVSNGNIQMSNAGHPMPIIMNAAEGSADYLYPNENFTGPGLAICDDAIYECVERKLNPHDTVMLYTDGLSEVENPKGEEFGEGAILAAVSKRLDLPLTDFCARLHEDACEFGGVDAVKDDVCLVGFRLYS